MDTSELKNLRLCKKCNEYLPKTIEFFSQRKTDKEGFMLYCKNCINREKREKRSNLRKTWEKGGKLENQEGRRCTICKTIYPETSDYFGTHKNNQCKLDTYCKLCRREKTKENYHKNKQKWRETHSRSSEFKKNKIIEYKQQTEGCVKCNEKRYWLLDFHHVDPQTKLFQISQGGEKGWEKILEEISKCVLLCANCHRDFHFLEKTQKINLDQYLVGKLQKITL